MSKITKTEINKSIISILKDELIIRGASKEIISVMENWDIENPTTNDIEKLKSLVSNSVYEIENRLLIAGFLSVS